MFNKRKIGFFLDNRLTWLFGLCKTPKKTILFESFGGKQYSDNPRAISEKMHELFPEYEIVWALGKDSSSYNLIPDYVRVIPNKGLKRLNAMARTFAYVTNEANESNVYKKRNQFIVQTWHGDRVPKKVIYDAWEDGKRPVPVVDAKVTDICIAASDIGEKVYRTAFKYNGAVLKVGMPRNDKLVNEHTNEQKRIRENLGIANNEKILLYAPTFRDNQTSKQNVMVNLGSVVQHLSKNGKKWRCLVRAHSASKGLYTDDAKLQYLDVSQYPDMADLLLISDMLITDYSSCAGDFILRKRPVILAMFDYENYVKNCRNFNFNPCDVGFIVAMNQLELNDIIDKYTDDDYRNNCEKIITYFNICETGNSSEKICKIIDEEYKKRVRRTEK